MNIKFSFIFDRCCTVLGPVFNSKVNSVTYLHLTWKGISYCLTLLGNRNFRLSLAFITIADRELMFPPRPGITLHAWLTSESSSMLNRSEV